MKKSVVKKTIKTIILILFLIFSGNYETENYEKKHIRILRETSAECTLFLNRNDEFPINNPCNVLLIGSGARNTIKGGLGSGDVESRYYTTCEEGLEKAGFKITSKDWLNEFIKIKEKKIKEHLDYIKKLKKKLKDFSSKYMVSFPEYEYNLEIKNKEKKVDFAIYVLSWNSGEGIDRRLIKGDIFLTDTEVKDILYLNKKYKKFMLVLNVCGFVDLSPVKEVSNILLLSQLGVVTGDILADIILGKQNPSGKLSSKWASIKDYKFIKELGKIDDTNYKEGIYVGYRYFNSVGIKPLYPLGYGKSYTSFDISKKSLTNIKDKIIIKIKVKNIGDFPGKEVIQVYISSSQSNKDKPYQSLILFKKTDELKPLEVAEIQLIFKLRNVARYDEEKSCYILDNGNYIIRVGNNSENTKIYGYIELDEDIITQQLKNIKGDYDTGFKDYKPNIILKDDLTHIQKIILTQNDFEYKKIQYNYKYKIDDKLLKLKNSKLAHLCLGGFISNKEHILGIVGSTTKKVKDVKNLIRIADGPAG